MHPHISLTVVIAIVFMLLGCFDFSFEPDWPEPGTIMATAASPDQAAVAKLITKKERGHYQFEIRDSGSGDMLAQSVISAPVGYHEHLVSIDWVERKRAEATIDRDFGDYNLKFTLSY